LDVYLPTDMRIGVEHEAPLVGGVTALAGEVLLQAELRVTIYRTQVDPRWAASRVRFVPCFA